MLLARQSAHGANKLSDLASPGARRGGVLLPFGPPFNRSPCIRQQHSLSPPAGMAVPWSGSGPHISGILNFRMIPPLRHADNADHRLAAG
jgi:hypothetical protein